MAKSINQVLLIGNLGKDPECKTFDNGVQVASFTLATSIGGYEKQDGTKVEEKTQWHNVVCWRGLADLAGKYLHKGDRVTIFGSIQYREYEKDGQRKFTTDIVVDDMVLMSGGTKTEPREQRPALTASDAPDEKKHDDLPF